MNKFIRILCATLPFFAAEAIQYITINILLFINIELTAEVMYLYSTIGIAVSGVVFYFWYHYEIQGELYGSVKRLVTVKNIVILTTIGIGCQLLFTGLMSLLVPYLTDIFQDYSNVVERLTTGNHLLVFILVIFVAPITEELIFRGVILHMANRHIAFIGANLLQSVLFGIYHGNLVQGVYASLLGFLLGLIYYKYQSIYAAITLHIIINASSYLVSNFPKTVLSYGIMVVSGGLLLIIALQFLPVPRCILHLMGSDITLNHTREQ